MFGKNWKTSTGGLAAILGGLAGLLKGIVDGDLSMESVSILVSTIGAGFGLLKAKDHDTVGVGTTAVKVKE